MVLLNIAIVRSVVMQAMPASAMTICGSKAPSDAQPSRHGDAPGKATHAACAFCSAAAHAPLNACAPAPPTPMTVSWAPYETPSSHGPRGPPAWRAKARAPPSALVI
jgi:hypothetical protein